MNAKCAYNRMLYELDTRGGEINPRIEMTDEGLLTVSSVEGHIIRP